MHRTMTTIAISFLTLLAVCCVAVVLPAETCLNQRPTTVRPDSTRFAIAGQIDVDTDGKTDIELLRQLIQLNGGVIDAELDINGKIKGQLHPDTVYLIVGQFPDRASAPRKVVQQFEAFMRRAAELHVRVIHIDKLLQSGTSRSSLKSDAESVFRPRHLPAQGRRSIY